MACYRGGRPLLQRPSTEDRIKERADAVVLSVDALDQPPWSGRNSPPLAA